MKEAVCIGTPGLLIEEKELSANFSPHFKNQIEFLLLFLLTTVQESMKKPGFGERKFVPIGFSQQHTKNSHAF